MCSRLNNDNSKMSMSSSLELYIVKSTFVDETIRDGNREIILVHLITSVCKETGKLAII